jgi:hypothetical protein
MTVVKNFKNIAKQREATPSVARQNAGKLHNARHLGW